MHYTDPVWYDKIRVGYGPIENFMSNLSKEAALSRKYTNHSIRSTVMGLLGEQYEGRIVIGWSGHKSEGTVKQYIRKLPTKKKREISNYLGNNIQPKAPKYAFQSIPAATSKPPEDPLPQQQNTEQPQLPQEYDIQALDDAPSDDLLIQVLEEIEKKNEAQQNQPQAVAVQNPQGNPLMPSNTMNIQQNVSNIQNVNAMKPPMVPTMYFGGHSTVTINYNFNSPK